MVHGCAGEQIAKKVLKQKAKKAEEFSKKHRGGAEVMLNEAVRCLSGGRCPGLLLKVLKNQKDVLIDEMLDVWEEEHPEKSADDLMDEARPE